MRPCARFIMLTLVVSGLIVAPVSINAPSMVLASEATAVVEQEQAAISCDQGCGHEEPAGLVHHSDCCIAGTCAMSAGIAAATAVPVGQLFARSIAYAPSAFAELLGIEAIPTTHPPKAAA